MELMYTVADPTDAGLDFHSSSSGRWKNNVNPIENPIQKLEGLSGLTFTWDEEYGDHEDNGFIAEEVGGILPQIVGYEENGADATGMDYSRMAALLVEATKAMRAGYLNLVNTLNVQLKNQASSLNDLQIENQHLRAKLEQAK